MTTPCDLQPLAFLQKITSSHKNMQSCTLQDIINVLKNKNTLIRLNERGLFILLLSELLNHQYDHFLKSVKTLRVEVCPHLKVVRKKREDDDRAPKRRRPRINVDGVDIGQIASDSVSNP